MIAAFRRPTGSPFVAMTLAERGGVISLLFLVWVAVGMSHLQSNDSTLLPIYLGFSIYLLAIALIFVMPGFRPSIFHPLVFYVLWIAVKGLLTGQASLAATGLASHESILVPSTGLNDAVALSFVLEAVALLALYVGYSLAPRLRATSMHPFVGQGLWLKSVFWIVCSGVGVIMMVRASGSIETLLFQRGIARTDRVVADIGSHWIWLAGISGIVPIFWLASDENAHKRALFWTIIFTAMIFKFVTTGSRGGTIMIPVLVFLVWSLQNRRISYSLLLASGLAALMLTGLLGEFRGSTQQSRDKILNEVSLQGDFFGWVGAALQELGGRTAENSGQIAILAIVPEQVPHLWGESYLSMPFVFVPSAIYENKPRAGGKLVSDLIYERPLTGIPPGSVGEAYWNFSYLGIFVVFAIYGSILKFIADVYLRNPKNPFVISLLILAFVQLEPQSQRFYLFIQSVIPLIAIYLLARKKLTFSKK